MHAWIDFVNGGEKRTYELTDEPAVVGRQRDCAVVLSSEAVSRKHARIERVGSRYSIRDLRSRNGTAVNGTLIQEPMYLAHNDVITICDCELRFRAAPDPPTDLSVTLIEGGFSEDQIVSTRDASTASGASVQVDPSAALDAVLGVTKELANNLDIDEVLPRVLDRIFEVYPNADRGVILLKDEAGELVPKAVKSKFPDDHELQVSRTVVARAMDRKEAILSANAAKDAQFEPSKSLLEMPIRSLMCVPLLGRDGESLGVIELHTEGSTTRFTKSCLDLLMIVGNAAASAVENSRLHEKSLSQDRLRRDLENAQEVQRSFLPPKEPDLPGYRFFVHYQAARTVGGDYYGFVPLPDDRLAIGIGDVSGKGMPAALMMAKLSADVRFALAQTQDPAEALGVVHQSLSEARLDDRFVTFVLMVLDCRTSRLLLANAGHQPPLIRLPDGRVDEIKAERVGVPLNVSGNPDLAPRTTAVDLPPGATVLAYTDGLSEAMNPRGELFGDERVRAAFEGSDGDPRRLGDRLIRRMTEFAEGRGQRDDTTVVCFGRLSGDG